MGINDVTCSDPSVGTFSLAEKSAMRNALNDVWAWYIDNRQRAGTHSWGGTADIVSDRGSKTPVGVLLGRSASNYGSVDGAMVALRNIRNIPVAFSRDLQEAHDRAVAVGNFRDSMRRHLRLLNTKYNLGVTGLV